MYKPAFYIFVIFMVIYITFSSDALSQEHKPYKAQIEKITDEDPWTFTASFRNDSSNVMKDLSYRFKGLKKGNGGTSNTTQSGHFEAPAGEKSSLATIQYNAITEGKIEITLEILHKETPIARDSLEINP